MNRRLRERRVITIPAVDWAALEATGRIGPPQDIPALSELAATDPPWRT